MKRASVTLPIRTKNTLNGREHWRITHKRSKEQRSLVALAMVSITRQWDGVTPLVVTVMRIAPSNGLDPHDALPASQKQVVDGVADALGLKNDRDPRVTWAYEQTRGQPKQHAVRIQIEKRHTDDTK